MMLGEHWFTVETTTRAGKIIFSVLFNENNNLTTQVTFATFLQSYCVRYIVQSWQTKLIKQNRLPENNIYSREGFLDIIT